MFGGIKNGIQTIGNAAKIKSTQDKMQKLMADIRISGISKNGKVTVTMTGDQKIVDIKIDPSLIVYVHDNFMTSDDADTVAKGQKILSDNIMEAANDAMSKVQVEMVKKIQENGGLGEMMEMLKGM
jgi:DNA-binding protein YbaB